MRPAPFIARRYLFARKSHNVINVISAVSAVGMAIGTAALVLILSVYNGFDSIIKANMSDMDPDLLIRRADGKRFIPEGPVFESVFNAPELASVGSVLTEKVFLMHEGRQALANARGVDFVFEEESGMASHVIAGNWALHNGSMPLAAIGTELANTLGANPRFVSQVSMYYPSTGTAFSPANPMASLRRKAMRVGSILSINADIDGTLLIVPIETLSEVLGCDDGEVSGVELRFPAGTGRRERLRFERSLSKQLAPDYEVLDRYRQNATLYRMMLYEKAAIWLILVFVVLIVALNIFGSLSMLIIEKKEDISTLRAMGASDALIRRIFVLEGWLVSLLGIAAGLVVGVALVLLQQHFGIIKMPGSFLVAAYPVVLRWTDVLVSAAAVAAIGLFVALAPAASAAPLPGRKRD